MLEAERAPAGELSLAFVGDRTMRRINRDFRGIDKTTDVLSFSYVDELHTGGSLGEIFVSPVVAGRIVESQGFTTNTFKPAYIKDKRAFNVDRPLKRVYR